MALKDFIVFGWNKGERTKFHTKEIWGYTITIGDRDDIYRIVSDDYLIAKVIWDSTFFIFETCFIDMSPQTGVPGTSARHWRYNKTLRTLFFAETVNSEEEQIIDIALGKKKHRKNLDQLKIKYPKYKSLFDCVRDKRYMYDYSQRHGYDLLNCFGQCVIR